MKHLTADPDLSRLSESFRGVVGKALEKTPARRFDSMNEMLRAVEAAASLSPASGEKGRGEGVEASLPKYVVNETRTTPAPYTQPPQNRGEREQHVIPVAARLPLAKPVAREQSLPARDRLSDLTGAMTKAPLVAAIVIIPWAAIAGHLDDLMLLGKSFLVTLAIAWAAILTVGGSSAGTPFVWNKRLRMAVCGIMIGILAFWLDGWPGPEFGSDDAEASLTETYLFHTLRMSPSSVNVLGHYVLYYGVAVGLIGWWKMASRDRKESFSLWYVWTAVFRAWC